MRARVAGQLLHLLPYFPLDDDIGPPKPGGGGDLHPSELGVRLTAWFLKHLKRSY